MDLHTHDNLITDLEQIYQEIDLDPEWFDGDEEKYLRYRAVASDALEALRGYNMGERESVDAAIYEYVRAQDIDPDNFDYSSINDELDSIGAEA